MLQEFLKRVNRGRGIAKKYIFAQKCLLKCHTARLNSNVESFEGNFHHLMRQGPLKLLVT